MHEEDNKNTNDDTQAYLTTSTAPGRTLGSLPRIETLAVNEPSILKTTASVWGERIARLLSTHVWSPLEMNSNVLLFNFFNPK